MDTMTQKQINIENHNIKLERVELPHGRFYKTPCGFLYPSITTILSQIPNPELEQWKASIGEEKAKEISTKATTNGTKLHTYCEDYLTHKNPKLDFFDKQSYNGLSTVLDMVTPVMLESSAFSHKARVAGTFDCVGYYKDKLYVIDWKTTSKIKHDGQFDNYWLQTAAYSMMIYETYNILIPNLLIVMQNISDGETYVFTSTAQKWIPRFIKIRKSITM